MPLVPGCGGIENWHKYTFVRFHIFSGNDRLFID